VIGPEFHHAPFFSELIQGLEQENRRRGYSLVFSTVSESSITDQLNDLERDHPAEGIILLGTNLSADEVESIQRIHPTLVLLDAFFPSLNVESVVMNNYMGAAQAASLVRRLGHIHIGYVGSHQRIPNFDQRQATFEEKIKAARLGIAREHRWFVRPTIDGAREDLTGQLRSTDALPTIAFCENDYLAIGLIKACVDVGVDVPGQLSVVGFDDIPQSSVVQPELTTIRVDKRRMASTALSQLINLAESGDRATKTSCLIGTTLVERGSTSPPRWK
jgi:LacI family transcriptional regulator